MSPSLFTASARLAAVLNRRTHGTRATDRTYADERALHPGQVVGPEVKQLRLPLATLPKLLGAGVCKRDHGWCAGLPPAEGTRVAWLGAAWLSPCWG
ncbi:MAG: hypothetical protein QMC46_01330 [Burkholderiaceae bacterium]